MSKALTEGHPVPIHEGDAKEIKRKPVVIAEVGRAGAPDLIDPGPDQLPLQAHRDLPFTLPGHFDLEHVEKENEQAVCPSGCRLLVGNGSTESGIWSEGPLGDLTAPTSGRGKPRNAVGRSRGGGIEQRGCGALLLLLPRLPLRRSILHLAESRLTQAVIGQIIRRIEPAAWSPGPASHVDSLAGGGRRSMSEIKARVGHKNRKPEPDERIRGRITMSPVEPGSGVLGAPIAGLDIDVALQALVEITDSHDRFFGDLARQMAKALGVRHALVAVPVGPKRAVTLGYWNVDALAPDLEWDLSGSPCEDVVVGHLRNHLSGLAKRFPAAPAQTSLTIESYLGIPLTATDGKVLGYLCVFDPRPMPADPRRLSFIQIFGERALAELVRLRVERTLTESERRYRDLFDEAPIAYVHEDLNSRFIRANRAALRILGLRPDEVVGTVGLSLVPDTLDAQRRAREAVESIGRGTDTSGVVLELRRKDNARPIWIQWWSKPEPGGKFTRTMFVDITDRVLLEQEQARLQAQNLYLREEIKSVHNFEEIVGQSPALLSVLAKVERVAKTDASILITGETGTGKELIARAVHSASRRHEKPLIKLNCAALPKGLIESELFGHEKGAFSGAIQRRIGRFELAQGGTIFLDEIGEVPSDIQVKLLRVLQEREFERLGGNHTIQVDVRVIAATNRDLRKAVRDGDFREDLYYRLNVFPIELPPLRDRRDDIPSLVKYFVQKYSLRVDRRIESIDLDTMDRLTSYAWRGNVRELQNIIERALILSTTPVLRVEPAMLAEPVPAEAQSVNARGDLAALQRDRILEVLEKTNWIIEGDRGAAKVLGLHPNTLRGRMKKLDLSRPVNRE